MESTFIRTSCEKDINSAIIQFSRYELCNNLGFNPYCDVNKGCPLSNFFGPLGQISMCVDAFNITEDQMRSANQKFLKTYGGATPNTTR
jgi:hypothetical protein